MEGFIIILIIVLICVAIKYFATNESSSSNVSTHTSISSNRYTSNEADAAEAARRARQEQAARAGEAWLKSLENTNDGLTMLQRVRNDARIKKAERAVGKGFEYRYDPEIRRSIYAMMESAEKAGVNEQTQCKIAAMMATSNKLDIRFDLYIRSESAYKELSDGHGLILIRPNGNEVEIVSTHMHTHELRNQSQASKISYNEIFEKYLILSSTELYKVFQLDEKPKFDNSFRKQVSDLTQPLFNEIFKTNGPFDSWPDDAINRFSSYFRSSCYLIYCDLLVAFPSRSPQDVCSALAKMFEYNEMDKYLTDDLFEDICEDDPEEVQKQEFSIAIQVGLMLAIDNYLFGGLSFGVVCNCCGNYMRFEKDISTENSSCPGCGRKFRFLYQTTASNLLQRINDGEHFQTNCPICGNNTPLDIDSDTYEVTCLNCQELFDCVFPDDKDNCNCDNDDYYRLTDEEIAELSGDYDENDEVEYNKDINSLVRNIVSQFFEIAFSPKTNNWESDYARYDLVIYLFFNLHCAACRHPNRIVYRNDYNKVFEDMIITYANRYFEIADNQAVRKFFDSRVQKYDSIMMSPDIEDKDQESIEALIDFISADLHSDPFTNTLYITPAFDRMKITSQAMTLYKTAIENVSDDFHQLMN